MSSLRLTAVVLMFVLFSACRSQATDPRESLETAIPEGIRLLEAKDYTSFVKTFVTPDDLKRITEMTTIEKMVEAFSKEKASRLLAALKEIKDQKPQLEDDGAKAVYKLKDPNGRGLQFAKVGKLWYISN